MGQLTDDPVGIRRVSRVIGTWQPVGRLTATAKVHQYRTPAQRTRHTQQLARVGRIERSFQAVKEHEDRRIIPHGRGMHPGQFDEIAIGQVENLRLACQRNERPQSRQQGLHMAVAESSGGAEIGGKRRT